eukprot:1191112-Pleurochrysis_carterae.AAC.1
MVTGNIALPARAPCSTPPYHERCAAQRRRAARKTLYAEQLTPNYKNNNKTSAPSWIKLGDDQ